MRSRPMPRNFIAGELAPWLDGISNQMTQQGCRTLENWIVRKQGQATRRPGTFYAGEVKDSADSTILVPVTIDDDNRYVLEIGDAYIRFWDQATHALITHPSTTTIYEVTSPWSTAEIANLAYIYSPSEKSVHFVHSNHPEYSLIHSADASWAIETSKWVTSKAYALFDNTYRAVKTTNDVDFEWQNKYSSSLQVYVRRGKKWSDGTTVFDASPYRAYFSFEDTEGTAWSVNTFDSGAGGYGGDAYILDSGLGSFVQGSASAMGTGSIWVSNDGFQTSSEVNVQSAVAYEVVTYSRTEEIWRATGAGRSAYSYDKSTWVSLTDASVLATNGLGGMAAGTIWVLAGGTRIYTATSGLAPFTVALSVTGFTFQDVDVGNSNGVPLWVAIGQSGSTSTTQLGIYASSTGTVWTKTYTGTMWGNTGVAAGGSARSVAWINNRFVVAPLDETSKYLTSPDGSTWQSVTIPEKFGMARIGAIVASDDYFVDFSDSENYFTRISANEGRKIVAGTSAHPDRIYGSRVGEFSNFYFDDYADSAFSYDILGERNVDIQWMMGGMGGLVVGTRTAEGIMLGSPSEGITTNTAQFKWLSTFGSDSVQPVRAGNTIIFVQRGGEIIRGFRPDLGANSPDLTAFADHIAEGGIVEIDHQEDPQGIVWFVRGDGQLLGLTFDGQTVAWSRVKPASTSLSVGIVESVAVIPTSGAEDEVWCVVKRVVGAGTKRYVEYFDTLKVDTAASAHYLDSGAEVTSGVTFATLTCLTHLAGENVDAMIDGTRHVSGLTVSASGTITVAPYSGTTIHAGLPYTSYLQTMRGDYGSPYGDGAGLNKRTTDLLVWVHDSSALAKFGPTTTTATETIAYTSSTTLNTEVCSINFPGQYDRDGYIWCVVTDPRPFTLVAMTPDSVTGDR